MTYRNNFAWKGSSGTLYVSCKCGQRFWGDWAQSLAMS